MHISRIPENLAKQGIPGQIKEKQKHDKNTIHLPRQGLWKCSKISTLWGKRGRIFALVVVRDYGNTTNGKMKNRKCGYSSKCMEQSLKSSSNLSYLQTKTGNTS